MIRRVIELLLLVALAIGGFQAWSTGLERSRIRAEYDRLILATGDLPIGDPARIHVRALPTGEPLHYAWRMSIPAGYKMTTNGISGAGGGMGGGSQVTSKPEEFIARVRLREVDGIVFAFERFFQGAGTFNLGDQSLADLIRGHEAEIGVEQFGSKGVETFAVDEQVVLLRLTLPKELQDDPTRKFSPREKMTRTPTLFTMEIGQAKPRTGPDSSLPAKAK